MTIVGGTASKLSGGKFANGAVSAAFVMMYNEMGHRKTFGDVNIDSNIKRILWLKKNVGQIEAVAFFYSQVKPYGRWDYKRVYGRELGEDIGNFNYGATGAAVGFNMDTLLRAAGLIQEFVGSYDPQYGHFYGNYPYGDDPNDQQMIMEGYYYYKRNYV